MFGLFTRSKVEDWEIDLLRNVITRLPSEYSNLINQINDKMFRGVLVGAGDIPGYVAFTFDSKILKKYDRSTEKDFKLNKIKVYDNKSQSFVQYAIFVSSGTISGYSLGNGKGAKKFDIDLNKIDTSNFRKEFVGDSDYNRIAAILSDEEKSLLNSSHVYSVSIDNKEYFHIKDLSDGDFIGVDESGITYKITHDPMEVIPLNKKIVEALSDDPN